jgi:hypothetical protein
VVVTRAAPPASGVALALAVARGAVVPPGRNGRRLVAIDGPSGAGKSTFADAVAAVWPRPLELVRLDEVYPGWHGLERGARVLSAALVRPWARGVVGRVPGWDWSADGAGPVRIVRPGTDLLVEGCGAFAAIGALSAVRIWVHAGDGVRKRAALERDHGAFDPYWEMWDAQWRTYTARTGASAALADLRVRGVSSSVAAFSS